MIKSANEGVRRLTRNSRSQSKSSLKSKNHQTSRCSVRNKNRTSKLSEINRQNSENRSDCRSAKSRRSNFSKSPVSEKNLKSILKNKKVSARKDETYEAFFMKEHKSIQKQLLKAKAEIYQSNFKN